MRLHCQVVALDNDEGDNRQIKFDMVEDNRHFRISKKSGEVVVRRTFDQENANQEFVLTIVAEDQGMSDYFCPQFHLIITPSTIV